MKMFKVMIVMVVICLLALGANAQVISKAEKAIQEQPEQKVIRHVLFVVVNGLTRERIEAAYTPNLNGLAASGVKTSAVGVLPVNLEAFTASLLSGADPSIHGITEPGSRVKVQTLPDMMAGSGRTAVFISPDVDSANRLFKRKGNGEVRVSGVAKNDNAVVIDEAAKLLNRKKPFFMGIMLPGVTVESKGLGSETKRSKEVNAVDEQVGRLLATLRAQGIYDECLIVITGFDGSSGKNMTGKLTDSEGLVAPVVMTGPGLRTGEILPPVKITDIAPTTALLAGLPMSPESNGLVLWNALRSGTGFRQENLLLKRVKDLSDENVKLIGNAYRLTQEKGLVKAEKEDLDREKQQVQKTIADKDRQISWLKLKIGTLKGLELITVLVMGAGYVIEYIYLRKKFLMF